MYCVKRNPKLSGDITSDVTDQVEITFEACSNKKLKCWSATQRQKFMRGKLFRLLATKNFIKQEQYGKVLSTLFVDVLEFGLGPGQKTMGENVMFLKQSELTHID